jgi:hypothetical protein
VNFLRSFNFFYTFRFFFFFILERSPRRCEQRFDTAAFRTLYHVPWHSIIFELVTIRSVRCIAFGVHMKKDIVSSSMPVRSVHIVIIGVFSWYYFVMRFVIVGALCKYKDN